MLDETDPLHSDLDSLDKAGWAESRESMQRLSPLSQLESLRKQEGLPLFQKRPPAEQAIDFEDHEDHQQTSCCSPADVEGDLR